MTRNEYTNLKTGESFEKWFKNFNERDQWEVEFSNKYRRKIGANLMDPYCYNQHKKTRDLDVILGNRKPDV